MTLKKWFLINYDGWNINTGEGVICTDLDRKTAQKIVDAHNAVVSTLNQAELK